MRVTLFAPPCCTIRAADFFDPRVTEERYFTRDALGRVYAVLTVSSRVKCWSSGGEEGNELAAVESIIKWWTTEEFPQLVGLPLVGIGASSGGYVPHHHRRRLRLVPSRM
jgi:hypothetical protein